MRHVHKSALLPYERDQMFHLVNDVGRYPEFIRWCRRADVVSADDEQVTATLLLEARGMSETVTTRNVILAPAHINLELVDGPFKEFRGGWTFTDLSSEHQVGTKVELDLRFSLHSRILNATFGVVFTKLANTMVDCFCDRAHDLFRS